MDWIRNNKFMAGFFLFLLAGVGGLGYLLYTSYGHYDEVAQQYDTQVKELQRLQKLKPYPDAEGLKKHTEFRQTYAASVNALQAKLAAFEPPADREVMTPVQFADKLRRTVEEVSGAAQSVGMALPENFYMGFEQYRGAPPEAALTPLLSRELDAVNDLVRLLIGLKVERLSSIKRAPLPQEIGGRGGANPAPAAQGRGPAAGKPAADLIVRYPVELVFTAQPSVIRDVLNKVVSAERLYIIRALLVKNEKSTGPLRDDPAVQQSNQPVAGVMPPAPESAPPGLNGVPAPPLPASGPPPLRYVVGLEKIEADLRIELVKVDPPAVAR